MATRINLDAMIPREDTAISADEYVMNLFGDFPIANLMTDNPVGKTIRKPNFQRETNHWDAEQIATFVASFLDNDVIPGLIFWKSPNHIFVVDGGHRLSALRAWMYDDYGDGVLSIAFYKGEISPQQKKLAKKARKLIEQKVDRFSKLQGLVGVPGSGQRVDRLFTRAIPVQWVQGSPEVAESSFYKINSQGTPLDDAEEMLIRYRRTPIAIGARAILRAGSGHKYWSAFNETYRNKVEELAREFHELLFQPQAELPLKTLDVPLGGSVSPLDALALLIEFLLIAANRNQTPKSISEYPPDESGEGTIAALKNALQVLGKITGNGTGSLGLHPAIYFYNERGSYSRYMFLGLTTLFTEKIKSNDSGFFKKFTSCRKHIESFLLENKSILNLAVANMSRTQRVSRIGDLFDFLVTNLGKATIEEAIAHLGLQGKIVDVKSKKTASSISDETKTEVFVKSAIAAALKCPICSGYLYPLKSMTFDHVEPVSQNGPGSVDNTQMTHPYCNNAKESISIID